jgi:hypothetical protein
MSFDFVSYNLGECNDYELLKNNLDDSFLYFSINVLYF